MRELVRRSPRFFFWVALAGLALRLLFVFVDPQITDDSRVYADIANNWLTHGVYGITEAGKIVPTYIRLPGYPAFLALIFGIFGQDSFRAVLLIQTLIDLATCFLIADVVRRTFSSAETQRRANLDRATKVAFLLAALCPFLANYAGAVLTETLEVFFTTLALDLAVVGFDAVFRLNPLTEAMPSSTPRSDLVRRLRPGVWIGCGLAVAGAILLRPDGGLLLIAIEMYLAVLLAESALATNRQPTKGKRGHVVAVFAGSVLIGMVAVAPLMPWTRRNVHTLHQFQPLTPRYANNPGDYVAVGFNRWVKTWMADYASVQEIYWQVPGEEIDPTKLPSRAFDSLEQKQRTLELLDRYNRAKEIDANLDAQFAALAQDRIDAAPLRYYVWLPSVRIADMWLRPRTELTDADPRWWELNDDVKYSVLAVAFGVVNLAYVLLAAAGLFRFRDIQWVGLFLLFAIVRSAFLGTLENPEPRYTLECYPVVIALAGALWLSTRASSFQNL